MKKNRYRITVEYLPETPDAATVTSPLQFEANNHDDIFAIVQLLRSRGDFEPSAAAAFGVGLKLFSEVMLEDKNHPLFTTFRPHFAQFMRELKQGVRRA